MNVQYKEIEFQDELSARWLSTGIPFMKISQILALTAFAIMAGCASAPSDKPGFKANGAASLHWDEGRSALLSEIRKQPTNGELHFRNGEYLLAAGGFGDLQLARVAFYSAVRFAPDWWVPELGIAAVEARLSNHTAALSALLMAAEKRAEVDQLSVPIAVAAYRAGYFNLAFAAWEHAVQSGSLAEALDPEAADFLNTAFSGSSRYNVSDLSARLHGAEVSPVADTNPNVAIDAIIIKQTRTNGSSVGINLLDALQLQFGATLINQNYSKLSGQEGNRSFARALQVSIPSVNYAINIASETGSTYKLEASPSVIAVEGKASRFFEGRNITIVTAGNSFSSSNVIDRDVGIDLQVTPEKVTDSYVELSATLDVTDLGTSVVDTAGIRSLETEKTTTTTNARVAFGNALTIGLGETQINLATERGVPYVRRLLGLGRLAGVDVDGVRRNNTIVLIAVRRDQSADGAKLIDEREEILSLFGTMPDASGFVSLLPSQAPVLDYLNWVTG
jgi:hypothetical protein